MCSTDVRMLCKLKELEQKILIENMVHHHKRIQRVCSCFFEEMSAKSFLRVTSKVSRIDCGRELSRLCVNE